MAEYKDRSLAVTFAVGTPYYVIKPPEGNVLVEVFKGVKVIFYRITIFLISTELLHSED